MKKRVSTAIAAVLFAAGLAAAGRAGTARAEDAAASGSVALELPGSGVSFVLPERFEETQGVVLAGDGLELEEGVYYSTLRYYSFGQEKYDELLEKGADNRTEEERAFITSHIMLAAVVVTMDGNRSLEDFREWMEEMGDSADGYREIGTSGEYRSFMRLDPPRKVQPVLEEGYREEYESLLKALEEPGAIVLEEPLRSAAESGAPIRFTTVGLDGTEFDAQTLFGANKVTLVNVWTTYCTWCLKEMPDLEKLGKDMAAEGCGVIGVVADIAGADDERMIGEAREIVEMTGVTYPNLIPWSSFYGTLPASVVPTTYFVDSVGTVIGEPVTGARSYEEYQAMLREALGALGE